MRQLPSLAVIVASVALLAACSSTKVDQGSAPVSSGTGSASTGSSTGGSGALDPLNDPNSILAKRSIYFGFDQYSIKAEFNNVIEAHAAYLKSHPNRKVIIQGNTDSRGGSEYNLALGQKRAEAVRKALVALGVSDSQLEAVSFGKEKPKATGDNEAAWAENRRADLAYQ